MAATVGSISIDLSTNAQKFATGFKSAATTVESQSARMAKSVAAVEKGVAGIGSTLKTFVGGLAAGAGVAAIASLGGAFDKLKETIGEFDRIATDAKQSGLKPDTYQALAFAAKQANVEQESFNSALTIFAKNAGLAEKGTGALYAGLQKLNPQLLQNIINAKDQEERLKLVSDAMAQMTDATQKAALASVVFGKGGVEMARFLDQGRASIDAIKKSARDMGIIVPDELLQRAGELDDKLDVLSQVIHVQLGEALINLAPALTGAMQGFADLSKNINATSSAVDTFVSNPSWGNLNKLLVAMGSAPIRDGSILDVLANGRSTAAIQADIAEVQQRLADLKTEAAAGFEVGLATDRAQDELKALQQELKRTSIAAQAAANNAAGSLNELVQNSINAIGGKPAATTQVLPTVTRYGGDPNQITLPGNGAPTIQTNVNGSGVNVTKYSSDTADNTKETAGYTRDTADNIDRLDQNTGGYIRSLSRDMAGYSANQVNAIGSLADSFAAAQYDALDAITAQMVQAGLNTGSISQPSNMFGDQWDPQHGSHVGPILNLGRAPHWVQGTTSDDGSYNNQVSVAQPGSDITLNYYAAPGESVETAKQRARDMWNELMLQASRA
ncbi:hypothetical protein EOA79_21535 [Mesorhizobium sp. M1A.F.Ca.IN.020.03.2.1]|uniref:hypothetical protein n=1 Tax=Mesorhizobium sp. M1A.F.Ca.IN.020.03.2.1 TaxID=2496769 RepID=UPI000FD3263C|nr:hypothetical protein [Mesorhizobium sp. M1A.F.Ca.IN.020.03.2.1]RUU99683.1 hypothetical protein EOA79_21535 [Mesorhizobium sp. M1A.F.Ca.IN.020.03.2.1]